MTLTLNNVLCHNKGLEVNKNHHPAGGDFLLTGIRFLNINGGQGMRYMK